MLFLASTSDKVQVVTDASATVKVHASWVDLSAGTETPSRTNTASIGTATTTDVVASPASSTVRNVKHLNIRNSHASTSVNVTVQHTDGTTTEELMKVNLLAGEELVFDQVGGWTHFDTNGGTYATVGPVASQTEMEAAASNGVFVTPLNLNWHPAVCKCWGKATVSGGTPSLAVNWNVTSLTDAGVNRLTVTIATDFSSANYAVTYGIEAQTTTYSATTTALAPVIRNGTLAAGSFTLDALEFDIGQTTDVSSWHWQCFGDQ